MKKENSTVQFFLCVDFHIPLLLVSVIKLLIFVRYTEDWYKCYSFSLDKKRTNLPISLSKKCEIIEIIIHTQLYTTHLYTMTTNNINTTTRKKIYIPTFLHLYISELK